MYIAANMQIREQVSGMVTEAVSRASDLDVCGALCEELVQLTNVDLVHAAVTISREHNRVSDHNGCLDIVRPLVSALPEVRALWARIGSRF